MEVSYRREMGINYVVLRGEQEEEHASRILTENRIPGLLPMRVSRVNDTREYYYELKNCIPLTKRYARESIDRGGMRDILISIRDALRVLEKYLIDAENLVLDPELVFADAETDRIYLCCMPELQGDLHQGLQQLAGFFIKKIDHQDEGSTEAAYELVRLCAQEYSDIEDLCQVFDGGQEVCAAETGGQTAEGMPGSALIGLSADPPAWIGEEGSRDYLGRAAAGIGRHRAAKIFEAAIPVLGCLLMGLLYLSGILSSIPVFIRAAIYILIGAAFVALSLLSRSLAQEDLTENDK